MKLSASAVIKASISPCFLGVRQQAVSSLQILSCLLPLLRNATFSNTVDHENGIWIVLESFDQ